MISGMRSKSPTRSPPGTHRPGFPRKSFSIRVRVNPLVVHHAVPHHEKPAQAIANFLEGHTPGLRQYLWKESGPEASRRVPVPEYSGSNRYTQKLKGRAATRRPGVRIRREEAARGPYRRRNSLSTLIFASSTCWTRGAMIGPIRNLSVQFVHFNPRDNGHRPSITCVAGVPLNELAKGSTSSSRATQDPRLVTPVRAASMACCSCHANTRFCATASTSSRIPSSSRKPSNELPLRCSCSGPATASSGCVVLM